LEVGEGEHTQEGREGKGNDGAAQPVALIAHRLPLACGGGAGARACVGGEVEEGGREGGREGAWVGVGKERAWCVGGGGTASPHPDPPCRSPEPPRSRPMPAPNCSA
jgi:hypothetical protein